ncbi:hypothetical protein JL09_g6011 [Pichia kudriavzevii]|uniref:Uncharacterized protein n=1 Tax=Pichia kudriavzevii TaxID=4909 RepID=A0A099NQN6_PICKU|nr:hypothetical protein JL09_g6011 [Pichia kudriavzevii]
MVVPKSANKNQKAIRMTSGKRPPQIAPRKLKTSPDAHISKKKGEMPSTVLRRHCSTSCGTIKMSQHAKEMDPKTDESCSRSGEGEI